MSLITEDVVLGTISKPETFYDYLPDENNICINANISWDRFVRALSKVEKMSTFYEVELVEIKTLIVGIATFYVDERLPLLGLDWSYLINKLGGFYACMLLSEEHREHRMFIQKAVFFLNAVRSKDEVGAVVTNFRHLSEKRVWDFFEDVNSEYYIVSSVANGPNLFVKNKETGISSYKVGLPTQIDRDENGCLLIGSSYSASAYKYNMSTTQVEELRETFPLILCHSYHGRLYKFYANGRIYIDNQEIDLKISNVCRVRVMGAYALLADWSLPYVIYRFDFSSYSIEKINISPVIIANDFCVKDEVLYVVDKEQGSVFKFSETFDYIGKSMRFGRGPGCLYDPISIRATQSNLQVLSWVDGTINELEPF